MDVPFYVKIVRKKTPAIRRKNKNWKAGDI
jgi:hypothetical protein